MAQHPRSSPPDRRPLHVQLSDMSAALKKAREELADRESRIAELDERIAEHEAQNKTVDQTINQLRQDYQNMRAVLDSREREIATVSRVNTLLVLLLIGGAMLALFASIAL